MVAGWLRKKFRLTVNWSLNTVVKGDNKVLLLGLEADTIGDEMFLHISRESESYFYVVERLLKLGRLEDALSEVEDPQDYEILEIADILVQYKHADAAEHLIEKRVKRSNNTDLIQWLKTFYETAGNVEGALDMAYRLFKAYPSSPMLERYQEIRRLAKKLKRWETMQPEVIEYLQQTHNVTLLIEIALDEKQNEHALQLLQAEQQKAR